MARKDLNMKVLTLLISYVCNRTWPNFEALLYMSQVFNVDVMVLIAEVKDFNE